MEVGETFCAEPRLFEDGGVFCSRPFGFNRLLVITATMIGLVALPASGQAGPHFEPVLATSADDSLLRARLTALSPLVTRDEARRVTNTAYRTGRELAREWGVVSWAPGLQNFLVNIGAKNGGLCHQWAAELLVRLDALKLRTLELHWGESFAGTLREHNVIVVTAKGQPFAQGILLDNWRRSGWLLWGPVAQDSRYQWKENKAEVARRLQRSRKSVLKAREARAGSG